MTWQSESFEGRTYDFTDDAVTVAWQQARVTAGSVSHDLPVSDPQAPLELWRLVDAPDAHERVVGAVEVKISPGADGTAWLHVVCEETRHEVVMQVPGRGARTQMLQLDLPLASLRGAVAIRVLMVDHAARAQGLANGTSNVLLLVVDRPPDSFGSGIKATWNADYFEQQGIQNALSAVDFTGGGEPRLMLNSAVQDLEPLLSSTAPHGRTALARKLLLDWIEVDTWVALGRRAAQDAYELDAADQLKLIEEAYLEGWQGAVLEGLAGRLGAGGVADKKAEAARQFLSKDRVDEVRARISHSVAAGSGLRLRIENLAAELPKLQAGEEHA